MMCYSILPESLLLLESLIMPSILWEILCMLSCLRLDPLSRLGNLLFFVVIQRDSFSSVESVKAASDAFCPASGKVLEVNTVVVVASVDHRLFPRLLPLSTSLLWRRDGS